MSIIPSDANILLAKSPIFITYTNEITDFNNMTVKLWVWSGLIAEKPLSPTYDLIAYKNRQSADSLSIEISDYISPLIEPLPTSNFFTTESVGDFGEFINVQYQIDSYNYDNLTGDNEDVETIVSPVLLASLGYGFVNQMASPKIEINDDKLIDNSKRISIENLIHYDVELVSSSDTSTAVVNRTFTTNFKSICTKGYKPRQVLFLNKNGLIDSFTFPRVSSQKLKYTSDKFNKTASLNNSNSVNDVLAYNYKISNNFNTIFNKNGNVEWIFNTDNLDEFNVDVIEQLYLSERHWLVDYEYNSFIPIQLTDDTFERKTAIKDRGKMNYTIKFIESNDYIQNIR